MIKLKISTKEIKALFEYLHVCILLAREEILNGSDFNVYEISDSVIVKWKPWNEDIKTSLKVTERHALIDEFEKLQKKLLQEVDPKYELRLKNVQLSKAAGHFILLYMLKAEHAAGTIIPSRKRIDHIMLSVKSQANVIMQSLT